jgi:hypothetical protein
MSAVRPCGGKVRPITLANAPEEEEKGEGQREITGYSTAPKSATNSGGISVLRREILMPWGDLCEGKKREEEEEYWGFIGEGTEWPLRSSRERDRGRDQGDGFQ